MGLIAGPAATAAIDGFFSTFTSMLLENMTGVADHSSGEIFATSLFVAGFSGVTAGLIDGVTTSSKDLIKNFQMHSSKNITTKLKLLKQGVTNSLPHSGINFFVNGLVLKPYEI